jgi:RecA/RadA recombinase
MYTVKEKSYRGLLILLLLPGLVFAGWCGYNIHKDSDERSRLKKDYSEVNNIQYGLLSVDRWRDSITELVSAQIDRFKLNGRQEAALKESLNKVLNALIDQAVEMMNEKKKTLGEKLQKFAFNTFVNVDKIRERVPEFSQTILDQIKDPENKKNLKFIANDKLGEFAKKTHNNIIEESNYKKILNQYGMQNADELNKFIGDRTDKLQQRIYRNAFFIIAVMLVFLLIWIIIIKHKVYYTPMFVISVLLAVIVLVIGVSSPMIEIDARIKELNFMLMSKNIQFRDQVIFFQSKSILDVVHILIATKKLDSVFVGGLILVFSVLFPMTKLISTEIYLFGREKWKKNSVINFFAFKSSKWSMADVMVVAIFMAYIGFKGILDTQLAGLNMQTNSLTSITTNNTSLQPGFLLFIAFVLFNLILSEILKRITTKYVTARGHTVER